MHRWDPRERRGICAGTTLKPAKGSGNWRYGQAVSEDPRLRAPVTFTACIASPMDATLKTPFGPEPQLSFCRSIRRLSAHFSKDGFSCHILSEKFSLALSVYWFSCLHRRRTHWQVRVPASISLPTIWVFPDPLAA